jgi:PhzF family phenazine biosynthesis protein
MKIPYYQIDAFTTEKPFSGNPAGVCILPEWLPDDVLQNVAFENNLSETAFMIENQGHFKLRWFTPSTEIDLCGHATLAPAFLIMNVLDPKSTEVTFTTNSGTLLAKRMGDLTEINFPSRLPQKSRPPDGLVESIGLEPIDVFKSRDYLLLYENEEQIRSIKPDMSKLAKVNCFAVITSAKGDKCDFVSRFFAPGSGVPEDPVTGSAHSTLIPFWANQLHKNDLHALQLSERGGELFCKNMEDRVLMSGRCRMYFQGEVLI